MYGAKSVAWYIINYCEDHDCGMSNLKLQKILYFVQAQFLVFTPSHSPCFSDTIEAWDFGPVVPSVYHFYKRFGNGIIPVNHNDSLIPFYQKIYDSDKKLIDTIIDKTKCYSNAALTELVHSQTPWRSSYSLSPYSEISNEMIYAFFKC